MRLRKILFADLDDTLFQSHHKASPGEDWAPLAYLTDGSPISYANPHQQSAIDLFLKEMVVIPVTARNHNAYQRVHIPFAAEAILNYGGIVLNSDGQPDEHWLGASQEQSRKVTDSLILWEKAMNDENDRLRLNLRVRIISDFGIPFYVIAKSKSGCIADVESATMFCKDFRRKLGADNVFIHSNNNNLAIIPRWLDKRNAVEYLRERYASAHGEILTFGMGDSVVDLGFISACNYMIVPTASQISTERLGAAL